MLFKPRWKFARFRKINYNSRMNIDIDIRTRPGNSPYKRHIMQDI